MSVLNLSKIDFSHDYLLNGRVSLKQPKAGYRVAIDPILLAASIYAYPGESILEVGAGVGAASLCLAHRISDCRIIGVEQDRELVYLATDNIRDNFLRERVEILCGNLLNPPPRLAAGSYSQVISNPPYFEAGRGKQSPISNKRSSNYGYEVTLEDWVKFCLLMLKPQGKLTFIYKADMLDKILNLFNGKLGEIVIFPLWSGPDRVASRVIIKGVKGSYQGLSLRHGLTLHQADGAFSNEAEMILRDAEPLII